MTCIVPERPSALVWEPASRKDLQSFSKKWFVAETLTPCRKKFSGFSQRSVKFSGRDIKSFLL